MTLTEIFAKAGLNTLLGMGTVFAMLIFISCVISLFRFLPEAGKNDGKTPAASREKPGSLKRAGERRGPGADCGDCRGCGGRFKRRTSGVCTGRKSVCRKVYQKN